MALAIHPSETSLLELNHPAGVITLLNISEPGVAPDHLQRRIQLLHAQCDVHRSTHLHPLSAGLPGLELLDLPKAAAHRFTHGVLNSETPKLMNRVSF